MLSLGDSPACKTAKDEWYWHNPNKNFLLKSKQYKITFIVNFLLEENVCSESNFKGKMTNFQLLSGVLESGTEIFFFDI